MLNKTNVKHPSFRKKFWDAVLEHKSGRTENGCAGKFRTQRAEIRVKWCKIEKRVIAAVFPDNARGYSLSRDIVEAALFG